MTDISEALRELLLAKAAGRIDAEEFERRQAVLYSELLAGGPAPNKNLRWLWLLGVVIVGAAVGLYVWLGNPGTSSVSPLPPMSAMPMPSGGRPEQAGSGDLKTLASRLAEKLIKDPTNGEGWTLLGQTYVELRQYKEADNAFAKAAALDRMDPKLLADWADAHVVANNRKWDSAARDIVKQALAADPGNLKALALAGSEAFDRADYKQAITLWQRLRSAAPPGSTDAKLADANIEEARAKMTGKQP